VKNKALIAVLAAAAVYYIVPWIKSKTTASQREDLLAWVDIAVAAAQQLHYQSSGEQRLQHALKVLADEGFDINDKTVRSAIEAAVLKLHQELGNGK
jgi:hypothetical protein